MCILDFLKEHSSKSLSEKYLQKQMMNKYKRDNVIHFNDNISMVEKGKLLNNTLLANFILDRKREFEAKSATFDFSSDDRERSSADEDNCSTGYNSTCTLCTSSFSFCNTSQRSFT